MAAPTSVLDRERFIRFCPEAGGYVAYYWGTRIGTFESYLSAERALARHGLEVAARAEVEAERLAAERLLAAA